LRVVANGNPIELAPAATVADLVIALGWGAKWVVAERNGEPVNRSAMATTALDEGDRIELVRAVAGG
jgi:sulfur carrier protein